MWMRREGTGAPSTALAALSDTAGFLDSDDTPILNSVAWGLFRQYQQGGESLGKA